MRSMAVRKYLLCGLKMIAGVVHAQITHPRLIYVFV